MNRILKTSVASLFAASILAGGAFAASNDKGPDPVERQTIDQGSTGSIGGSAEMMSSDSMGMWKDGKITVVAVSTLNDVDPNRTMLEERMKSNPDEVTKLQAAVSNNAALKAQLESQNVQIGNIVAAEKAADGSVTFYVK
jgi:hypothetical protein